MAFEVLMTADAVRDLEELHTYISSHDSSAKAEHVLKKIEALFSSLARLPERGAYPEELLSLGIRDYRELFFKPYRVIYRIIEDRVYIAVIADGRRDMQTLLERRLLEY